MDLPVVSLPVVSESGEFLASSGIASEACHPQLNINVPLLTLDSNTKGRRHLSGSSAITMSPRGICLSVVVITVREARYLGYYLRHS